MEVELFQQSPFIAEHPHYITLDVLEISKVDIPLKEEVFIFDIDETLYSDTSHLQHMITETAIVFSEFIGISYEEALDLHTQAQKDVGMGIKKLILDYKLPSQFYINIHMRLIEKGSLKPDHQLKEMLFELKKTKTLMCFTNGTEMNARQVLEALDVSKAFDLVIVNDYLRTSTHKPHASAYAAVNLGLGLNEKVKKIVFFDDSFMNCTAGFQAGWQSYHISSENNLVSYLSHFLQEEINE